MQFIVGILIAIVGVLASVFHLNQDVSTYYDAVAVFVVFGGTLAVAVATFPFEFRLEMAQAVRLLMSGRRKALVLVAKECLDVCRQPLARINPENIPLDGLAGEIVRDGIELAWLGLPHAKINEILGDRIYHSFDRGLAVANAVKSLSKYPPAFGLVGTVLGLVSLMKAVSVGASAQETGTRMAVALVATLYGLLIANLVIAPAGENISKAYGEERRKAEMALVTVMLLVEKASLLEAQERFNAFLPSDQRLNIVFSGGSTDTTDFVNEARVA